MPKKKPSRSPRIATPPRRVIDGLYEAEELLEGGQREIIKRANSRITGLNKNLPYRQIWELLFGSRPDTGAPGVTRTRDPLLRK